MARTNTLYIIKNRIKTVTFYRFHLYMVSVNLLNTVYELDQLSVCSYQYVLLILQSRKNTIMICRVRLSISKSFFKIVYKTTAFVL